jgi:ATP-binding cassette subfamily F protein uup
MFGDGRITDLPGGIEEYLQRLDKPALAPQPKTAAPASDGAAQRRARKDLARIERRLDTLSRRETELNDAMGQAGGDAEELRLLDAELTSVAAERGELEEQWLSTAELVG